MRHTFEICFATLEQVVRERIRFALAIGFLVVQASVQATPSALGRCNSLVLEGDGLRAARGGLVWHACPLGQSLNQGGCSGEPVLATWKEVVELSARHSASTRTEWILPTRAQLTELAKACPDVFESAMWTSDADSSGTSYAWIAVPGNPTFTLAHADTKGTARLVRNSDIDDVRAFKTTLSKLGISELVTSIKYSAETRERDKFEAEAAMKKRASDNARFIEQLRTSRKCEQARDFARTRVEIERPLFSYDECVDERRFSELERSRDPQVQYLAAVKLEANGDRSRAKTLYLAIMELSPQSAIAIKAADRLASLTDVQAIERSNSRAEIASREAAQRAEELRSSVERTNSDSASRMYNACVVERDACYGRNGKNCYRNCDALR